MPRPWDKYATLLRVRERLQRLDAQALGEARRDVRLAEVQRDRLAEEQRRVLAEAGVAAGEQVDARKAQALIHYERHIAGRAVDKDAEIHALRGVEVRKRIQLEEAMKRLKIVERLTERVRLAYLNHVRKEEQKQFDETASLRSALERRTHRQ